MLLFQPPNFTVHSQWLSFDTQYTGPAYIQSYMYPVPFIFIRIRPSPLARGPLDLVTYTRSAVHSNPSAARRGQTLTLKDTSIPRPTRAAANSCVAACHSRADPSAAGENPDRVGRSVGAEWETAGKHRRLRPANPQPLVRSLSPPWFPMVAPPSDRVPSAVSFRPPASAFAAPLRRLVS